MATIKAIILNAEISDIWKKQGILGNNITEGGNIITDVRIFDANEESLETIQKKINAYLYTLNWRPIDWENLPDIRIPLGIVINGDDKKYALYLPEKFLGFEQPKKIIVRHTAPFLYKTPIEINRNVEVPVTKERSTLLALCWSIYFALMDNRALVLILDQLYILKAITICISNNNMLKYRNGDILKILMNLLRNMEANGATYDYFDEDAYIYFGGRLIVFYIPSANIISGNTDIPNTLGTDISLSSKSFQMYVTEVALKNKHL